MQEIDRCFKLNVLLFLFRNVGDAALRLGGAVILQVTAQASFALWRESRHLRFHIVRRNPRGLDRAARRRVIAGSRESQAAIGPERDHGLHGALAEGPGSDNFRPLVILKGASNDLRSRSRPAIDEHDELLSIRDVTRLGVCTAALACIAALGQNDRALVEESIRYGD